MVFYCMYYCIAVEEEKGQEVEKKKEENEGKVSLYITY